MSEHERNLEKLIELVEALKPYIEWTHNYSIAQVRLLKLLRLGPSNIIEFYYQGTVPFRFYVPKGDIDHIQSHYIMSESFWDQGTLEALAPVLRGKHVLDIGANVGNHSVYWGKLADVSSIQAFEPIPETFGILERNIELNGLKKTVKLHRCALGALNGTGDPTSRADNRMQAMVSTRSDTGGAIPVRTLDSFNLREVHFAKIDVEGHTIGMLQGSVATLKKFSPSLYIELFPFEANLCRDFLAEHGYEVMGSIEEGNFIFVHSSKTDDKQIFRNIVKGEWPH